MNNSLHVKSLKTLEKRIVVCPGLSVKVADEVSAFQRCWFIFLRGVIPYFKLQSPNSAPILAALGYFFCVGRARL